MILRYHYPFMSPANGGYAAVIGYSIAVLILMLVVCAVVVWLGNLRRPASARRAHPAVFDRHDAVGKLRHRAVVRGEQHRGPRVSGGAD